MTGPRRGEAPRARRVGRLLRLTGAALALTVAVSGCAVASAGNWGFRSSSGGGTVHLVYALWDPHEQIGYQKSIDVFERLHPNIKVTIENIPYTSFQAKITAEYISGNAPDVFWVNTPFLGDWVVDGMLENLTPLVRSAHIDLGQYYPSLVHLHMHDGKIYGLPKDWDTIAIYYNKTYFQQHHIAIPANLTWRPNGGGTFLRFLKEATTDVHGRNALQPGFDAGAVKTYAIAMDNDFQQGFGNYFAMNGGSVIPAPYARHASIDSPQNRVTLSYLTRTLVDAHVVVPNSATGPEAAGSNDETLFAEGRIAMYEAGDWNTVSISQLTGFKIGVIPLPAGPDGRVSVMNGLMDGIAANGKHKAAAWTLVRWLASARSQRIMGSGGYVWPAIKSLDPLFLRYWQAHGIDLAPFLAEAHGKTVNWPVGPGVGVAITTDLPEIMAPAYLGSESPAAVLAASQSQADYRLSNS